MNEQNELLTNEAKLLKYEEMCERYIKAEGLILKISNMNLFQRIFVLPKMASGFIYNIFNKYNF